MIEDYLNRFPVKALGTLRETERERKRETETDRQTQTQTDTDTEIERGGGVLVFEAFS